MTTEESSIVAEYEYTIEIGWDTHVHAGYAKYVTSTPEEAIELRGNHFHPDADSVVRREVGTEEWSYQQEDQKYDYKKKMDEYRIARAEEKRQFEIYRPKKSSALPNNRRARSGGPFIRPGELQIWYLTKGDYDMQKMNNEDLHDG